MKLTNSYVLAVLVFSAAPWDRRLSRVRVMDSGYSVAHGSIYVTVTYIVKSRNKQTEKRERESPNDVSLNIAQSIS